MKNHSSVNRFCLFVAAATLLGGTAARAQNPSAPAKAANSLSIYFDPGSAAVTPQGQTTLDQAARTYRDGKPIVMVVSGGTDSTGSAAANLRLSQQRADNVTAGSGGPRHSGRAVPDIGKRGNRTGCTRPRGNA